MRYIHRAGVIDEAAWDNGAEISFESVPAGGQTYVVTPDDVGRIQDFSIWSNSGGATITDFVFTQDASLLPGFADADLPPLKRHSMH